MIASIVFDLFSNHTLGVAGLLTTIGPAWGSSAKQLICCWRALDLLYGQEAFCICDRSRRETLTNRRGTLSRPCCLREIAAGGACWLCVAFVLLGNYSDSFLLFHGIRVVVPIPVGKEYSPVRPLLLVILWLFAISIGRALRPSFSLVTIVVWHLVPTA